MYLQWAWRVYKLCVPTLECLWVSVLSYHTFAAFPSLFYLHTLYYFINVYRLIKLAWSNQSFVIFSLFLIYSFFFRYLRTCTLHHTHNSNSCLIVRTLSTPIYLSYSPGVFGHRTILIWGDRNKAGGFVKELNDTLHMHYWGNFNYIFKDCFRQTCNRLAFDPFKKCRKLTQWKIQIVNCARA